MELAKERTIKSYMYRCCKALLTASKLCYQPGIADLGAAHLELLLLPAHLVFSTTTVGLLKLCWHEKNQRRPF